MDDRTDPQYKLRMPAELHDKLKASAKENHRSLNAEIVARLQFSFRLDSAKLTVPKEEFTETELLRAQLDRSVRQMQEMMEQVEVRTANIQRMLDETEKMEKDERLGRP